MELKLIGSENQTENIVVSDVLFNRDYNEALVHQVVTSYLSNARGATRAQKGRSDVAKSTRKPWRQKGTGRARSGSTRSPIWRTGGVVFAAKPRDFEQKLNKKMFRVGIRSILSELLRQNRLVVNDSIFPKTPKTKEFNIKLKTLEARRILIVVDKIDTNLALASRNIVNVEVIESANLSPVLLLAADKVVVSSVAIKQLGERLA